MKPHTKLSRNGNSWYVRLPKSILQASGLRPDSELFLVAKPGRVTIYSAAAAKKFSTEDKYIDAKQDAREAWDQAFEQVWLDLFGDEE